MIDFTDHLKKNIVGDIKNEETRYGLTDQWLSRSIGIVYCSKSIREKKNNLQKANALLKIAKDAVKSG